MVDLTPLEKAAKFKGLHELIKVLTGAHVTPLAQTTYRVLVMSNADSGSVEFIEWGNAFQPEGGRRELRTVISIRAIIGERSA